MIGTLPRRPYQLSMILEKSVNSSQIFHGVGGVVRQALLVTTKLSAKSWQKIVSCKRRFIQIKVYFLFIRKILFQMLLS